MLRMLCAQPFIRSITLYIPFWAFYILFSFIFVCLAPKTDNNKKNNIILTLNIIIFFFHFFFLGAGSQCRRGVSVADTMCMHKLSPLRAAKQNRPFFCVSVIQYASLRFDTWKRTAKYMNKWSNEPNANIITYPSRATTQTRGPKHMCMHHIYDTPTARRIHERRSFFVLFISFACHTVFVRLMFSLVRVNVFLVFEQHARTNRRNETIE